MNLNGLYIKYAISIIANQKAINTGICKSSFLVFIDKWLNIYANIRLEQSIRKSFLNEANSTAFLDEIITMTRNSRSRPSCEKLNGNRREFIRNKKDEIITICRSVCVPKSQLKRNRGETIRINPNTIISK